MPLTPDQLPDDIAELKRLVAAKDAELAAKIGELEAAKNGLLVTQLTIEKLKAQLAKLRRERFGASSERIERVITQLELALEEAEAASAETAAPGSEPEAASEAPPGTDAATPASTSAPEKKKRRQLPPELPRRDVVHTPSNVCKTCGGSELRKVGESVTEVLEYVPGRFEVVRHVRPACSCRKCETMVQAPMPDLPIPRGMVGASFLAHIATAKFCDHLPLYRQAEIYARSGLDIDRGQLAEWLGHLAWLLRPLAVLIAAHVMAGRVIHADDTPVPVLAPGAGKTKTGRQWVYLRDERPHAASAPPAVLYRYTPGSQGRALPRRTRPLRRLAARRWLRRLRSTLRDRRCANRGVAGSAARGRGRLLGARAPWLLRRVQIQRLGDRQRGTRSDRRAVRYRAADCGLARRTSPKRAPAHGQAEDRRSSASGSMRSCTRSRARATWPVLSAMPTGVGTLSAATSMMAGSSSAIMPRRTQSGRWLWDEKTGSSPAATKEAREPPCSIRSYEPLR